MSKHNRERKRNSSQVSLPVLTPDKLPPKPNLNGVVFSEPFFQWTANILTGNTRSCGACDECCHHLGVKDIGKPIQCRCEHQTGIAEKGCGIYGNHPKECKEYSCLWRAGWGNYFDRPSESGVLLHIDNHPIYGKDRLDLGSVEFIELRPNAIFQRFKSSADCLALLPKDGSVVVTVHFYGTPRAYYKNGVKPVYDCSKKVNGQEAYISDHKGQFFVQIGIRSEDGNIHVADGRKFSDEDYNRLVRSMPTQQLIAYLCQYPKEKEEVING